ncbi:MAG: phosphohydrolase [Candidatus Altiarchaeales archaeon HGW-Altiarchaeales-2]|nr:MAG: phosphohydrolase [Candidatus Altiarchaeales archaeon HGW-Altiarchaeales-2]
MKYEKYEIRDSVWGYISFNDMEKAIIDSPILQRLRRIKQLALTEMVYPGATNTRFEHSLGVMHLASRMYDNIVKKDKDIHILKKAGYLEEGDRTRQLIRLAALLHDIGHAPFSHSSESLMPTDSKTGEEYSHEDYTEAIIIGLLRKTIEENDLNNRKYNITADEIAGLITGNKKLLKDKIIWKKLLSGQLDADRGDYLLRDSYYTGVKYGVYDAERLIVSSVLGINPEAKGNDDYNSLAVGVEKGGWHVAESLIIARYMAFSQIVFHKTRVAYDYHLEEVMRSFLKEKFGKITFPLPTEKGIEEFLSLNDSTIWNYINENRKKDENCRAIIERDHIRSIDETPENPSDEDIDKIMGKTEILKSAGLFCHIAKSYKLWYEFGKSDSTEIIVFENYNNSKILSKYSKVVESLKDGTHQLRIYVKQKDREKAIKKTYNKK